MGNGRGGRKSEPGVSGWEDPVSVGTVFHDDAFLWGNYIYRTTE
jgi:hypothetical protein